MNPSYPRKEFALPDKPCGASLFPRYSPLNISGARGEKMTLCAPFGRKGYHIEKMNGLRNHFLAKTLPLVRFIGLNFDIFLFSDNQNVMS
jgi:hypothetical protein